MDIVKLMIAFWGHEFRTPPKCAENESTETLALIPGGESDPHASHGNSTKRMLGADMDTSSHTLRVMTDLTDMTGSI